MSRYRPPTHKSSPYITRSGYERLKAEEKALWTRRKVVTAALSAAAAEGDRSENAEYIYRKKELREIDRRVRYLQKRIPDLQVIDRRAGGDAIYFGAELELETGANMLTVRIVGADEIDPAKKHISIDSPLARALLKKQVNDVVEIQVEETTHTYAVLAVRYPDQ
jgi:transcription elongation factor GreB